MYVYSISTYHKHNHVKSLVGSSEELQFWEENSYHLDSRKVASGRSPVELIIKTTLKSSDRLEQILQEKKGLIDEIKIETSARMGE